MDVKVVDKPILGMKWNPARHERLTDGPWIGSVRNRTGNKDLFVYRHRVTKKFVLAEWVKEGVDCIELCTMSGPPDHWPDDLPKMEWVEWRVRQSGRSNAESIHQREIDRRKEEQRLIDSSDDDKKMAIRFLRRRGQHDIADQLQHGCCPYVGTEEGGEELEETMDRLIVGGRGRVYSLPDLTPPPDLTVQAR